MQHQVDSYSRRPVECKDASVIDHSESKLLTTSTSTSCQPGSEYPKESNECLSSPEDIKDEEWLEHIVGEHQDTSDFESGGLLNPPSEPQSLQPLTKTDNPQIIKYPQHAFSKGQSIPTCESEYPLATGPNKTDNIPVNAQFSTGSNDPTLTDRSNEYLSTDKRGSAAGEFNGGKDHTVGGSDREEDPTTGTFKEGEDSTTGGLNDGQDSITDELNEDKNCPAGRSIEDRIPMFGSNEGQNPTTGELYEGSDPTTGGSNGGQDPTTSESPKGEYPTTSGLKDGDDFTMAGLRDDHAESHYRWIE